MNASEQKLYRAKLFRDATAWKKPDRVPHASMFQLWQVHDAGYKLSEAMSDYAVMEKVTREHQEKYNFDMLVNTGVRNPYLVYKALGSQRYIIDDEKGSINYKDVYYCEHDELPEFAQDYWKFLWEKGMIRKFPWWGEDIPLSRIQKAVDARADFFGYAGRINRILEQEYGLPGFVAPNPFIMISFESVLNYIRGIRGASIDMRKEPAKLDALIETMDRMFFYPALEALKKAPDGPNENYCFDLGTTLLGQNMVNIKQWEKYYWPYLKQILDVAQEKKMTFSLFSQGKLDRFTDYLSSYPKGVISLMLEEDDVFEMRKKLPNCAIMGGMSNLLLGSGTKKQCVDLAKRLIDELGADGGYIMTQTKIGTFRNDGNAENLKAVCDFVREYQG